MVKEDSVDSEHAIGFPVFLCDPEAVLFRHRIGTVGVEGGGLSLGNLLHFAVQLRGRGLVKAGLLFQPQDMDGLQGPENPQGIHIS